jgi:FemAB-related protein (PEP-CTERM system-associated)
MTLLMTSPVRTLREDETIALPDALACAAGFVGGGPWLRFVRSVYNFPVYRLVFQSGNQIQGWLALVHVKHIVFGEYLTTSPFGSYGGFAYSSHVARDALLEKARSLGESLGVHYVNVRFQAGEETPPDAWVQHPVYATYLVDLAEDPLQSMSTYSSDHRNHIRKSLKRGFSITFGRRELLHDAYEGIARSMHELGSPYHSKEYIAAMVEHLGDALEFAVVYGPGRDLAGAGVFIRQGDLVTNLHANILRRFRPDYAGEFLYWSAIEHYGRQGLKTFDLGRSLIGSGNETFKMKWRPRRQPLAYWYALMPGRTLPELHQKNPKFQLAIATWKRLPAWVVRRLGPLLIWGLA